MPSRAWKSLPVQVRNIYSWPTPEDKWKCETAA